MTTIRIANCGADITDTDYWDSDHASAGLCYLSGNAGAWRLLVPEAAEGLLPEMRTGTRVTIERSLHPGAHAAAIDLVFEDGTESPFSLALSPGQIDRAMLPGQCRLTVWTQAGGRVLDLACQVAA